VVFFCMATSSGEDMIRGMDFVFSRNRLNVAISLARCLAYLACTDELLDARARTVEEMRLIATLNAFVEWAKRPVSADTVSAYRRELVSIAARRRHPSHPVPTERDQAQRK
jgi:hypothetical protein